MASLDHGILNAPLGSRARGGSLNAQMDRALRQSARDSRQFHADCFGRTAEQRRRIKQILTELPDERVMALAKPMGCRKPSTARARLYSAFICNPAAALLALEREAA